MFDQNEKTEEETLAGTHAVHSEGIKDVTKEMKNSLCMFYICYWLQYHAGTIKLSSSRNLV